MPCWEGKQYTLVSSDNYDQYLKDLGVGMVLRKTANMMIPVTALNDNYDGSYTLSTQVPTKTMRITFRPGEEFDEETSDGRWVKGVCTLNGDTLIHEQRGDKPTTIVMEFSDNQLVSTYTIGGTRCVRVFQAS